MTLALKIEVMRGQCAGCLEEDMLGVELEPQATEADSLFACIECLARIPPALEEMAKWAARD